MRTAAFCTPCGPDLPGPLDGPGLGVGNLDGLSRSCRQFTRLLFLLTSRGGVTNVFKPQTIFILDHFKAREKYDDQLHLYPTQINIVPTYTLKN